MYLATGVVWWDIIQGLTKKKSWCVSLLFSFFILYGIGIGIYHPKYIWDNSLQKNPFFRVVKPFRKQNDTNFCLFTLYLLKLQLIQTEGKKAKNVFKEKKGKICFLVRETLNYRRYRKIKLFKLQSYWKWNTL